MNETIIERKDYKASISDAARQVLEAKQAKKVAKEMLDGMLENDPEFKVAQEAVRNANLQKKVAKNKVFESLMATAQRNKYEEKHNELKSAEERLSLALESQFVSSGSFNIDLPFGEKVTMKRKFTLGGKQLSLFE